MEFVGYLSTWLRILSLANLSRSPRSCVFVGWSGVGQGSPEVTAWRPGLDARSGARRLARVGGNGGPERPGRCWAALAGGLLSSQDQASPQSNPA